MDKKRVYTFGNGQAEGKADMKNLLGGKGANLAEMNLIGIPVPPGFTITTAVSYTHLSGSSWNFMPTPCPQRSRTTLNPFFSACS